MNLREPIQILLAEDNPGDARLTVEALKEWKLENNISVVPNGQEAMDFLAQKGRYANARRPDIILLDLNMPQKNGQEVLVEVKANPELKHIPVVVLTTSNMEEDILSVYNLHANSFITKPIDLESFIKAMKLLEDYWFSTVKLPSRDTQQIS